MQEVTARLNEYRQSPRKVRVVADLIRGKRAEDAIAWFDFLGKRAAGPLQKLIRSAIANAKSRNVPTEDLVIKEIRVDGGKILYRRRPASHGRAPMIRKRTSRIFLVLEAKESNMAGKPKKKSKKLEAKS